MFELNLAAKTKEETILKVYLQNNASDVLAEKINNGVKIEKDGKTLINKKDLAGFMEYAYKEAQAKAEKGARSAMVDDNTVFGWLIHYFEEDSIEGKLYNGDGTEYKPKPASGAVTPAATYTPTLPKPKPQLSLFDMIDGGMTGQTEAEPESDEPDDEQQYDEPDNNEPDVECQAEVQEVESNNDTAAVPQGLRKIGENQYADSDGIVYDNPDVSGDDLNTQINTLYRLLGDVFIMRG